MKQEINLMFFSGFYETIHDGAFDSEIENILTEDYPGKEYDDFNFTIDYKGYVNKYIQAVNSELGFKLKFRELIQPREYNFTTDKLICTIDKKDLKKIESALNSESFARLVKENFTSRSGFISFYSNDVREWKEKKLTEWDSVELGTLLKSYLIENNIKELDYDCYDYCHGNGQYVSYTLNES